MLRKRIKKKKPLKLLTKQNKLHSKNNASYSKSTYFYFSGPFFLKKVSNLQKHLVRFCSEKRDFPNKTDNCMDLERNGHFSTYLLPVACSMALLLVFGWMVNPFAQGGGEAYAAINEDLGNGSTISLAIINNGSEVGDNGTVSTEVKSGQVSYISNSIKVTTNKISKYYVGVQSATNSSDLTGSSTGTTITGVGSNVSTGSFGDNTWGYALTDNTAMSDESLTYSTLPSYSASTSPQYASAQNPANGEHELKLTFAAKIRADKPADHYQAAALVSVAAEAKSVTTWGEYNITQMQQMTSSICTAAQDGTTGQLTDKRDNKTYWVTKLKDGNCWMTQNLALDLSTSKALTSSDSDVSSSWTPTANTQQGTITKFPSSSDLTLSYNPGEYVYTTPTTQNNCGTSGISKLEGCPNWTLVSGLSKDTSANEQAHYLAGNYYSYTVATAGTAPSTTGTATSSICPKGWQLPINSGDKSYRNLLTSYGTNSGLLYGTQDIRLAPLYFVYSGYVDDTSTLRNAGNYGVYWSSTANHAVQAYYLLFDSGVDPSNYNFARWYGLSVRCVAR